MKRSSEDSIKFSKNKKVKSNDAVEMKSSMETNDKVVKKQPGHWSAGLISAMDDPELQVRSDDLIVAIKDKYAKAEHHYLVLPKENITSLKGLRKEHRKLLKHMERVGRELVEGVTNRNFKFGYHAVPSMARLHLHVISDDMNSPSLKTKKHWNSFTSEFFIESEDIIKELKENGNITPISPERSKTLLDGALKCHKCEFVGKNMPILKRHLLEHIKT